MKISVAICTYNGEKYIKDQLVSIISQTRLPDEILVGDDGSTDSTVDIIKKLLSNFGISFRIIENKTNLGVNANFQNVINQCKGDIIFTADQDDVWAPNKIEKIIACFEREPEDVLVFSNGYVTDEEMNISGDMWSDFHFTKAKQKIFEGHRYYDVLFSNNCIAGTAMAFKRDFFKQFSYMSFMTVHDYWIALHAPLYGNIGMVDDSLIYYRQHENNVLGVRPNKLLDKIKRWIKKSKTALDNSEERYIMSHEFYNRNKVLLQKLNLKEETNKWVQFNMWRYSLKENNRIIAALEILRNMVTGEYRHFYARSFAGFQDIFACFLS